MDDAAPEARFGERECTELEAAAFRRLVEHMRERSDVQNVDLMELAGFCRNCLSRWYREAAEELGLELSEAAPASASTACLTRSGRGALNARRATRDTLPWPQQIGRPLCPSEQRWRVPLRRPQIGSSPRLSSSGSNCVDDAIGKAVLQGLLRREESVAFAVVMDAFD
jgi:hypothetical protein